ncbi:hypothetical protein PROFUN_14410 [Planoprotostelium fungivorum]|uniref:Mutator-like transposase domain-containing protein n=1 Tax=Planoprotostelium fungivorum TaxID=1890364 RepID=A0A2P6MX76_9EUKA|nr:hypothetical protein PROFUN_14410 [Planoprotostelium fungivorum]
MPFTTKAQSRWRESIAILGRAKRPHCESDDTMQREQSSCKLLSSEVPAPLTCFVPKHSLNDLDPSMMDIPLLPDIEPAQQLDAMVAGDTTRRTPSMACQHVSTSHVQDALIVKPGTPAPQIKLRDQSHTVVLTKERAHKEPKNQPLINVRATLASITLGEEAGAAVNFVLSKKNIPLVHITGSYDACWSKRSHMHHGSASAGTGVVIGQKSHKVILRGTCFVPEHSLNDLDPSMMDIPLLPDIEPAQQLELENESFRLIHFHTMINFITTFCFCQCNGHWRYDKEDTKYGLSTRLHFSCSRCLDRQAWDTSPQIKLRDQSHTKERAHKEPKNQPLINVRATLASITLGGGASLLDRLFGFLHVPHLMTHRTFDKISRKIGSIIGITAEESKEKSRHTEVPLSEEAGAAVNFVLSKKNIPLVHITGSYDACWSKRSHMHHGSASAGTGVVIGQKSHKVILRTIVPHYYGEHTHCGKWCKGRGNPQWQSILNHTGLQSQLNSIIETFACDVNARKIAHISTKRDVQFRSSPLFAEGYEQRTQCSIHIMRGSGHHSLQRRIICCLQMIASMSSTTLSTVRGSIGSHNGIPRNIQEFREEEEAKSGIEGAEDITEEEESGGAIIFNRRGYSRWIHRKPTPEETNNSNCFGSSVFPRGDKKARRLGITTANISRYGSSTLKVRGPLSFTEFLSKKKQ